MEAAETLGVALDVRNISEEEHLEVLLQRGGKRQTPFFVDEENDFQTYESNEIIRYLCEQHGGNPDDFSEEAANVCSI